MWTTTMVLCGIGVLAEAYLLGSINFGVVVSRLLYHEDVRRILVVPALPLPFVRTSSW